MVMHLIFHLPRRATNLLITAIRSILQLARVGNEIIQQIPKGSTTIIDRYELDPAVHTYVSCPSCFHLSLYDSPEIVGERCSHRPTLASPPCDVPLWKDIKLAGGKVLQVPRRKYLHQDLKQWMARLLSRPGIEEMIDSPRSTANTEDDPYFDIWDAPEFKKFQLNGRPF